MREIKFRAWDKERKELRQIVALSFSLGTIAFEPITTRPVVQLTNKCDIMQYTELKDKTGKEIYEGDVVSAIYFDGVTQVIKTQSVSYEDASYSIGERLLEHVPDVVVVGNIYENPELLGDGNENV